MARGQALGGGPRGLRRERREGNAHLRGVRPEDVCFAVPIHRHELGVRAPNRGG